MVRLYPPHHGSPGPRTPPDRLRRGEEAPRTETTVDGAGAALWELRPPPRAGENRVGSPNGMSFLRTTTPHTTATEGRAGSLAAPAALPIAVESSCRCPRRRGAGGARPMGACGEGLRGKCQLSNNAGSSRPPPSLQENQKLRELVKIYGFKRWSLVASHFESRVGKQCRERCASPPSLSAEPTPPPPSSRPRSRPAPPPPPHRAPQVAQPPQSED